MNTFLSFDQEKSPFGKLGNQAGQWPEGVLIAGGCYTQVYTLKSP